MKKTKKNYAIIVLIVLLVAISIGYSAFSSSLNISGTATGSGKWDVKFTSAVLKDASTLEVETSKEHGDDPTITPMGDYVTFNVKLSYPGDAVVLETTITNEGTIAAKLEDITVTGAGSDKIIVTSSTPTQDEVLNANGGTCTSQFLIQWDPEDKIPSTTDLTKDLKVTFKYVQNVNKTVSQPTQTDGN